MITFLKEISGSLASKWSTNYPTIFCIMLNSMLFVYGILLFFILKTLPAVT